MPYTVKLGHDRTGYSWRLYQSSQIYSTSKLKNVNWNTNSKYCLYSTCIWCRQI